jgi:2,5-furandicarboxylate decarboxylase 1
VEIKKQVNLKYELGRVLATLEKKNMGGALFTNIIQSDIPVVSGVLNSPGKVAIALQCPKNQITERIAASFEQPIKPRIVDNGPCQEVEYFGESIDLSSLPIPLHAPYDSGHFITGGVVFSKSLDGETQNLSFQRMQVKGKNKLGIMINEWRHLKEFYDEAEKAGKSLPIAVAIGLDPVIMIAAGLRYEGDEIELAGALRGFPIEVVKCKTSDIYVPALAEIIIEGEILPGIRELEGPLGEFTGHYSEPWESPVLKVSCITCRKNPIYQTIVGASSEHLYLGSVLSREPILKKHVTYVSKNVTGVHILPCSSGFAAVISIDKRNPGETQKCCSGCYDCLR